MTDVVLTEDMVLASVQNLYNAVIAMRVQMRVLLFTLPDEVQVEYERLYAKLDPTEFAELVAMSDTKFRRYMRRRRNG